MDEATNDMPTALSVGHAVHGQLTEFFDSYVLVGFVAGSNEPLVMHTRCDPKTTIALNTLLVSAIQKEK